MQDFVTFLTNQWVLSLIFVGLLLAFLVNELRGQTNMSQVSPAEAVSLINHQEAVVIDVRMPEAFSNGHIVDAINIPLENLEKKLGSLQKYAGKPMILVCNIGKTSQKAYDILKSKAFNVLNLAGGLEAWRAAQLPLTKKG